MLQRTFLLTTSVCVCVFVGGDYVCVLCLCDQMDEALMAKEAEKAELLKRRQKLREQLARAGIDGVELERAR